MRLDAISSDQYPLAKSNRRVESHLAAGDIARDVATHTAFEKRGVRSASPLTVPSILGGHCRSPLPPSCSPYFPDSSLFLVCAINMVNCIDRGKGHRPQQEGLLVLVCAINTVNYIDRGSLLLLFCSINMFNYIHPQRGHRQQHESQVYHSHPPFSSRDPSIPLPHSPSLLLLFCAINMVNYIDRGAIASNGINGSPSHCQGDVCDSGSGIQGDFALSNFQDGLLATAFLVGLLTASPLFAHASKRHNPFRLIALGLLVWTLAVAGCGLSPGLLSLLLCRMLVGVGEASFISLAAPFIDDNAPPGKTAQWLATFYLCIPVGFALGYLYGGVAGPLLGWRGAFLLEAVFMLPFVVYTATADPPPLKGRTHAHGSAAADNDEERAEGAPSLAASSHTEVAPQSKHSEGSLLDDSLSLARNDIFTINVLGYAAYTFVIGAYAYWAPKAMREIFNEERADALFGGITVVTGVGGTLFGGLMLDRMGATIPNALLLQSRVTVVGAIFCLLAFASPHITLFVVFMAVGEFFIFAIQGPANIVSLQCVPSNLRALAIAAATVVAHLLGDVPSPPILGLLQDMVGNWRISMGMFTAVLLPAAALWAHGATLVVPPSHRNRPFNPSSTPPHLPNPPFTISPLHASSCLPPFQILFFLRNPCRRNPGGAPLTLQHNPFQSSIVFLCRCNAGGAFLSGQPNHSSHSLFQLLLTPCHYLPLTHFISLTFLPTPSTAQPLQVQHRWCLPLTTARPFNPIPSLPFFSSAGATLVVPSSHDNQTIHPILHSSSSSPSTFSPLHASSCLPSFQNPSSLSTPAGATLVMPSSHDNQTIHPILHSSSSSPSTFSPLHASSCLPSFQNPSSLSTPAGATLVVPSSHDNQTIHPILHSSSSSPSTFSPLHASSCLPSFQNPSSLSTPAVPLLVALAPVLAPVRASTAQ
ncbi:unnamed protein product [Closterium sp. Naga37s-1]|nr:unnamed protein product [Closterium sp. Naga37s-1]